MTGMSLASTFISILVQSSETVYDVALKKVHSYITGRILEAKVYSQ
jgi:hypothetical protein